jgi:hypothetical protein
LNNIAALICKSIKAFYKDIAQMIARLDKNLRKFNFGVAYNRIAK